VAHAIGAFDRAPGDALTLRTLPVFFVVVRVLIESGVTVVTEAAFQDQVWRPNLEPLRSLASLRVVQCHTDPGAARRRMRDRVESRPAHADYEIIANARYLDEFRRLVIPVPTIDVDTTSGYKPPLERVVAFINDA
jgi:hypothetical protein